MDKYAKDDATDSHLKWGVEQRLRFAERRLYWSGTINRADIMSRFGIAANQVSSDMNRLREKYPGALQYDTVARTYRAAPNYRPTDPGQGELLRELRLIAEGQLDRAESVLAQVPPLAIAEAPERAVDADVLRAVIQAINARRMISAGYISLHTPGNAQRTLTPHALVHDGFRWHVRAHDVGDGAWKDFLLARLSEVSDAGPAELTADDDYAWGTRVSIEIAPHPRFDARQRRIIASDYGMTAKQRLVLKVREAVKWYVLKRLGLVPGHEQRPAQEQQIVLTETLPEAGRHTVVSATPAFRAA